VAAAGLVIGQAAVLADGISGVFAGGAGWDELRPTLMALAAVVAGRAAVAWAQEATSYRAAAGVKAELRGRLLAHLLRLGPAWLHEERSGEVATLATRGLDALDAYFARYLPQLLSAALVPAILLVWILPVDLIAGLTIALTLPLIPVFMPWSGAAPNGSTPVS
jgi:ATP-binding cassette subfamily C protein CydD/ATP-binding cassette subfamily C protein CydCD